VLKALIINLKILIEKAELLCHILKAMFTVIL